MSQKELHTRVSSVKAPLARFPAIGFSIAFLGILLFGALAFNLVTNGPLVQLDKTISIGLHRIAVQSSQLVVEAMRAVGFVGNQVVFFTSLLLSAFWFIRRDFRKALMMAGGVGGGGALFWLFVGLFNRPRPVFPDPLETIHLGGFPSGHTLGTVLFYGLLAYLYVPRLPSRALKILVVIVVAAFVLLLGYSRIFMGSHYLTDVLAGFALGLAWGGLWYTGLELFFQGDKSRRLQT